jgi:hypothetical protein
MFKMSQIEPLSGKKLRDSLMAVYSNTAIFSGD